MKPKKYLVYSLIPILLVLGGGWFIVMSGQFVWFVVYVIAVRLVWVPVCPLFVPLEALGKRR